MPEPKKTEEAVSIVPAKDGKKEPQGPDSHIHHSVTEREALHKDSGDGRPEKRG